ncbi:hypothetical protein niasHT_018425 [Heterodera trifolii]|uniref:Uncharacterized protein n=1 Tax=Heterodera trifolii TaxID=157864 RepID=A0ABD2KWC0_9BILA
MCFGPWRRRRMGCVAVQFVAGAECEQTTNVPISETTILPNGCSLHSSHHHVQGASCDGSQPGSAPQQPDAVHQWPDRDRGGVDECVPGGARAEAKQAMTNIGEILTYAGSSFKHVINCNIMVADMSDFQAVNETIKNFFTEDTYPARSFFQVVKLPKSAYVMIDVVAIVQGQS